MREMTASNFEYTSKADGRKAVMALRSRQSSGLAGKTTPSRNRLLLVVDDSPSSTAAVKYVANIMGHRRGFHVCLAHFLSPLPPMLLEYGGSEDPDNEGRLDIQLQRDQQKWINTARKKAEPVLNRARRRLRKSGLPATALTTQFSNPAHEQDNASGEILDLARRNKCRTIVVGRQSLSWFSRITAGKDLAEKLVRQGKNLTIWIVE